MAPGVFVEDLFSFLKVKQRIRKTHGVFSNTLQTYKLFLKNVFHRVLSLIVIRYYHAKF